MKLSFFIISLLVLGFLLQLFLPWWIIAPLAAALAWGFALSPRAAFAGSLLAGLILWAGYALYLDNGILSDRLGQVAGGIGPWLLFVLTGLIGGLLAALGGVTGSLGQQLLSKYR